MELTLGKEVDIAETDEKDAQQEGTFKKEEEILEKGEETVGEEERGEAGTCILFWYKFFLIFAISSSIFVTLSFKSHSRVTRASSANATILIHH